MAPDCVIAANATSLSEEEPKQPQIDNLELVFYDCRVNGDVPHPQAAIDTGAL